MTPEQETLAAVQAEIAKGTAEERVLIGQCHSAIIKLIEDHGAPAIMAVALVGARLAAEA